MKIIAITACPVGAAHTYMAKAALERAAKEAGHEIKVETQSTMGDKDVLTKEDIANADVFINAADIAIMNGERFDGIPTYFTSGSKAIRKAKQIIQEAIDLVTEE